MKKNKQRDYYILLYNLRRQAPSVVFKRAEDGRDLDERNKENVNFMCGQNYDTRHRKHTKKPKQELGIRRKSESAKSTTKDEGR